MDLSAGGTQTNTTATSNPAGDARAAQQGRLGGHGLPDLLSGMPDANSVNQLMQNPAISQMMQSVLSNPQYMNQVYLILSCSALFCIDPFSHILSFGWNFFTQVSFLFPFFRFLALTHNYAACLIPILNFER